MKKIVFIAFALVFTFGLSCTSNSQTIPGDSLYLGQTPPGNIPKKFNLPATVNFFVAEKIAISPDGTELYFCELNGYPWSASKVKQYKYANNAWTGPFDIFSGFIAPVFSSGGDTLYFEDGQPYAWYSTRTGTGWTVPVRFWISSHKQHNLQPVNSQKYYLVSDPVISTNGDVSRLVTANTDTAVQTLGIPLNSASNGMDFFIAKDESYIIRVIKSNGLGMLYISYRKPDGSWTNPKNLGPQVNAPQAWEWGPYVSNDNKYLFFTRQVSSIDLFWVRIDNVLDSLKHTNSIPYLKTQIPNQVDTVGRSLTYRISDTTFIDDDGNNTLRYSATLSNGNPLPAWLSFDTTARTFSGVPTAAGIFTIKVTAKDTANANVLSQFTITIAASPTAVERSQIQLPENSMLIQNYPNPFNPSTTIYYSLKTATHITLTIYSILGQKICMLYDAFQSAGVHSLVWNGTDYKSNPVSSGIYLYQLKANGINLNKKMILLR